jgi:hypothetical protein
MLGPLLAGVALLAGAASVRAGRRMLGGLDARILDSGILDSGQSRYPASFFVLTESNAEEGIRLARELKEELESLGVTAVFRRQSSELVVRPIEVDADFSRASFVEWRLRSHPLVAEIVTEKVRPTLARRTEAPERWRYEQEMSESESALLRDQMDQWLHSDSGKKRMPLVNPLRIREIERLMERSRKATLTPEEQERLRDEVNTLIHHNQRLERKPIPVSIRQKAPHLRRRRGYDE